MDLLIGLLVGSLIEWIILLIVIPIAQRLADFSMPEPVEMAWKLAVIVLLKNVVAVGVGAVAGGFVGNIVAAVVFWVGLWKVFDLDMFGAIIIVVVSFLARVFIIALIIAAIVSAFSS